MLVRDMLRWCTLEALRPSALLTQTSPSWPTIAGTLVWDSKIGPLDRLATDEKFAPVIAVYTDDESLDPIAKHGAQLYKAAIDLVFEIGVVAEYVDDDSKRLIVDFADSDAAVEAMVSRLEDQIFFCLHYGPSGALFRQMVKLGESENFWHSKPLRSGEEIIRIGRRTVTFHVRMKESCYEAVPDFTRTGLARLPPALQAIARQLTGSGYISDLVAGTAAAASQMPVRVDLDRVDIKTASPAGVVMSDALAAIEQPRRAEAVITLADATVSATAIHP
jgi:hypothetical protein